MKNGFVWGLLAGVAGYWAVQHFTGVGSTGKGAPGGSPGRKGRR